MLTVILPDIAAITCDHRLATDHHGLDTSAEIQCLLCESAGAYDHDHQRSTSASIREIGQGGTILMRWNYTGSWWYSRHSRTDAHSLPTSTTAALAEP